MTTTGQIKGIQKRIKGLSLDSKVHFFDSQEEYEEATSAGTVRINDICIIDDISEDE